VVDLPPFFIFLLTKIQEYVIILYGGNMNEKLWLLIDSTHKKLLRARLWTTSLDDYKQDIEDAIKALEEAKKKIEEEK
tara:strand:- start:597 stop:830 length:234 start_codon:yes stop_codon:yes gene_type:complete